MNNDTFLPEIIIDRTSRPLIPQEAYHPVKRCPNCDSVFLTDIQCEACGRSLLYHPLGEPFSAKSLYGMKERYYKTLPLVVRLFPLLEDKTNESAKSYSRHLNKRFVDLLTVMDPDSDLNTLNRRLFYVELLELIDEMIRYGESPHIIQSRIEDHLGFSGSVLTNEIMNYFNDSILHHHGAHPPHWFTLVLEHRLGGLIKVDSVLKFVVIAATAVAMAITYFDVIRLQFGR